MVGVVVLLHLDLHTQAIFLTLVLFHQPFVECFRIFIRLGRPYERDHNIQVGCIE